MLATRWSLCRERDLALPAALMDLSTVLDVRPEDEFLRSGIFPAPSYIPLGKLEHRLGELRRTARSSPIAVVPIAFFFVRGWSGGSARAAAISSVGSRMVIPSWKAAGFADRSCGLNGPTPDARHYATRAYTGVAGERTFEIIGKRTGGFVWKL